MDKRDLKIQALREAMRDRVASITVEYEDRIADLRIELTETTQERDHLRAEVARLHEEAAKDATQEEDPADSAA